MRIVATPSSITSDVSTTPETRLRRSWSPTARVSAAALSRDWKDIRRTTTRPTNEANVMMPMPPTWISSRMTAWPKPVQ